MMKIMKKILFIIFVLLLTGCDITYNLKIDGNFIEDITIYENVDEGTVDDELRMRLDTGIPLMNNSSSKFYEHKLNNGSNYIKLFLKGTFDNFSDGSNAIFQACDSYSLVNDDDLLVLKASGFKLFDEYAGLNTITVNIVCKNRVISNNADRVNGDTYTWVIDGDNYADKVINLSFKQNNVLRDFNNGFSDPMVRFAAVIFLLILISFIVYLFTRFIFIKRNKI